MVSRTEDCNRAFCRNATYYRNGLCGTSVIQWICAPGWPITPEYPIPLGVHSIGFVGDPFVPRLSLIVPFQRDESALETTLISVLESRDRDVELIIVHSGDYEDPYELAHDEAVVLETEQGSSLSERLNLAARTACSPIVQVVLPGTTLEASWSDEGLSWFDDDATHAVSLPIRDASTDRVVFGMNAEQLPHRGMAFSTDSVAGPLLAGTMIRRRSLLKLGGWSELISESLLDLELTLLMRTLGLGIGVVQSDHLVRDFKAATSACSPFEVGKGCGVLACAYGELPDSHIVIEPLVRRLGHLACGLMNPQVAAERLGWVLGVRDRSLVQYVAQRVDFSHHAFEAPVSLPMPIPSAPTAAEQRRAA